MARTERYPGQRSEYGGGDGDPQKTPDGQMLDLPGIASATGKRARILRQVGMADFDVAASDVVGMANTGLSTKDMSDAQLEAYKHDLAISARRAAERERLADVTNDYSEDQDQYLGE